MSFFSLFGARIFMSGDEAGCKAHMEDIKIMAAQLQQQAGFQNVPIIRLEKNFPDGTNIKGLIVNGDRQIIASKPPYLPKGKKREEGISLTKDRIVIVGMDDGDYVDGYILFYDEKLSLLKQITITPATPFVMDLQGQLVVADRKTRKAYSADPYDYVHKIDMQKMEIETTLPLPQSEVYPGYRTITSINNYMDDDYFYVSALDYDTVYPNEKNRLFQIDKETFQITATTLMHHDQSEYLGAGGIGENTVAANGYVYSGGAAVLEKYDATLNYVGDINISASTNDSLSANSSVYNHKLKKIYGIVQVYGGGFRVIAIDVITGAIVDSAPLASISHRIIAVDQDRGYVYCGQYSLEGSHHVHVNKYDSALNYLGGSQPFENVIEILGMALSTDGNSLYFATGSYYTSSSSGSLLVKLKTSDMSLDKQATVPKWSLGLDLCPIPIIKGEREIEIP